MGQRRSQDFRDLLGALQGVRIPSETGGIEPHCLPGETETRCGQTSQRISCSQEHQGALWRAEGISWVSGGLLRGLFRGPSQNQARVCPLNRMTSRLRWSSTEW